MVKRFLGNLYRRLPVIRELQAIARSVEQLRTGEVIRLLDFELRDHPRYGDPKRLHRYSAHVCSQSGEDGMIREIFRRIGETNRVFAEVGVGDGRENNTAFLLSQGWTGFWIDGSRAVLDVLRRRTDLQSDCIRCRVAFASKENIAGLFGQLGVPNEFDLLSLDIDQNTYHVWDGLRAFRPRVVVVEYNASLPPDVDWTSHYRPSRTWDGSLNFGASLKAFERLGRERGYSLVGCDFIGANAFFVRNDLLGDKFAEPFTAENHYEPPRYSMIHRRGHPPAILDR